MLDFCSNLNLPQVSFSCKKISALLIKVNALGFLGDLISDILDGDSAPFGQRIRSDNTALRDLYDTTYFDFGLTPARNLKENQFVPMKTSDYRGKNVGFEIHGNIMSPNKFFSRGWGNPFHSIEQNFPPAKGRVWAFDITRLNESILIGNAVYPGDAAHVRSEEFLKILRIVGTATVGLLDEIPKIEIDFNETWNKYGIPDRIHVSMKHYRPFSDRDLQHVINLILHAYNHSDAPPVTAHYSMNTLDGTITLQNRETATEPEVKTRPTQEQATGSHPAPTDQGMPNDGFPYEFYRGLGLIDSEGMVEVPSFLGSVRIHMTQDEAKNHLLAYKP